MIRVARLFTLLFGALTILVALQIQRAGGIVEMVLSTAAIAGGALFAPIIWSLYSRRQTAASVVAISLISLLVNIALKIAGGVRHSFHLERTPETLFGVGLPLAMLSFMELWYRFRGGPLPAAALSDNSIVIGMAARPSRADSSAQNRFGINVLGIAMLIVGAGIGLLGLLATQFSAMAIAVGVVICIFGLSIVIIINR
jgi:hypothetical protein